MKGLLRRTKPLRHQRRDKGGNTHNFPFDTLTKVYRDTMYATQERYQGNPMYPERGPHGSVAAPVASLRSSAPKSDVTNHVGGLGVMSPTATKLSEWVAEQQHQHKGGVDHGHEHEHDEQHHSHGHAKTSLVSRGGVHNQAAPSPAPTSAPGDAAMRERLRAHLFEGKRGHNGRDAHINSSSNARTPSVRHSGVQIEILNTYRAMLREVRRMSDPDTRSTLASYIRSEFEKHRDVPRKNIMKIEWHLNYGKRKLEDLNAMSSHTKFTIVR